jgi:hypothetical protein
MIKMLMTKIREFVTRGVTLTHSNTVNGLRVVTSASWGCC